MAFHFTLDGVLRFRKSIERHEELRLLAATREVELVRQSIAEVDQATSASLVREAEQLAHGLTGAEIHFEILCRGALKHRRAELEQEIARREELRDRLRAVYQKAKQSREVVDTLREHEFALYRQQQARWEQRQLDDQFLLRRARHRG